MGARMVVRSRASVRSRGKGCVPELKTAQKRLDCGIRRSQIDVIGKIRPCAKWERDGRVRAWQEEE